MKKTGAPIGKNNKKHPFSGYESSDYSTLITIGMANMKKNNKKSPIPRNKPKKSTSNKGKKRSPKGKNTDFSTIWDVFQPIIP